MKRIAILRHAKSSWDQQDLKDFDRPLSERGWNAAQRMGKELVARGFTFDLILASTAVRVRQTIDGLKETMPAHAPVRFEQGMYLAGEDSLLSRVRQLPEDVHHPLLVGHNPGLERLVVDLAALDDNLRARVQHKFPTAAFALVELPADRWDRIEPGSGTIAELILPRELD